MRRLKPLSLLPAAGALALLVISMPAAAQDAGSAPAAKPSAPAGQTAKPDEPSPSAQAARPAAVAPIRGELIDVDTEAKKLTIKTAANTEMEFAYNDATQVSGAQAGVAGLASMKNTQVAVHFSENATTKEKLATRIEVQREPAAAPAAPSAPKPAPAPEAQPKPADPPSR